MIQPAGPQRQGISPERRILFRAEDVLTVLEIKSRGTFGEQSLKNIAKNFSDIKNVGKNIECVYLTLSERESYKWMATEKNISALVYTLFWHSGPEDHLNFRATGDWNRFIEKLKTIESSG